MDRELRICWRNCYGPEDPQHLADKELTAIDAMEDALDSCAETTRQLRQWITRFEACYLEADQEAAAIIQGIGRGRCPKPIPDRPARRREALANSSWILSAWCEDPEVRSLRTRVGDIEANELIRYLGPDSPLKIWQVERVVDHIREALDPNRHYFYLAFDKEGAEKHYRDDLEFLHQTQGTHIHDRLDDQPAEISLAYAIDLLMPCHWDFIGSLVIVLKAIGGDLHPGTPYTCCARNLRLSPLCRRLREISHTLQVHGKSTSAEKNCDASLLATLGKPTPQKRWLVASLEKTIRTQLETPFNMDLR